MPGASTNITTSGEAVFNAGGQILAKVLKRDNPIFAMRDDRQNALAQQGEWVPRLLGRRRLAPIIGWTGFDASVPFPAEDLNVFIQNLLGHHLGKAFVDTYIEAGMHWLCIGPAYRIHAIIKDGKPINRLSPGGDSIAYSNEALTDEIRPLPSGPDSAQGEIFTFDLWSALADLLSFLIPNPIIKTLLPILAQMLSSQASIGTERLGVWHTYWGDEDGPVNTLLAAQSALPAFVTGTAAMPASKWPWVCGIHWVLAILGDQSTWPNLEYDVEVRPLFSALTESASWLTRTDDDEVNPQRIEDSGINPAHGLYELLHTPWPHGLGIALDDIDVPALERLGVLCEAEHLPVHILAKDGVEAAKQIAALMEDVGIVARDLEGKISFYPVRQEPQQEGQIIPEADADIWSAGHAEQQIDHRRIGATDAAFTFDNYDRYDRVEGFTVPDDGHRLESGGVNLLKIELTTIADRRTAQKVAERRAAEVLVQPTRIGPMQMGRWARALKPGDVFTLDGRLWRVLDSTIDTSSAGATVDAMLDLYGVEQGSYHPENELENTSPVPRPDIAEDETPPVIIPESQQKVVYGAEYAVDVDHVLEGELVLEP